MAKKKKRVPCYICKKPTIVYDKRAISKLCKKHDTQKNRELLKKVPLSELLELYYTFIIRKVQPELTDDKKSTEELNYNLDRTQTNEYGEPL